MHTEKIKISASFHKNLWNNHFSWLLTDNFSKLKAEEHSRLVNLSSSISGSQNDREGFVKYNLRDKIQC